MATAATIHPVTSERLADLAELFCTNATTAGCWCMYFVAAPDEFRRGWRDGGNRARFEQLAAAEDTPVGLLAYDGEAPIGWCAAGPRSRYRRAIAPRVRILAGRDRAEDDDVWLVPCFFTRVGNRRRGTTHELLSAAVELARDRGASAVEGFPRAAGLPPSSEDYLGREEVFGACGFECIARPTPRRAVMRLEL